MASCLCSSQPSPPQGRRALPAFWWCLSHQAAAPQEVGGTREKELMFTPLRPVLQGNEGLGWHFLSCQLMSHYFLWLSSPTSCFLQSRYPIYQLETDIKARGFHPLLPGGQAAPAHNTGVLVLSSSLCCGGELPAQGGSASQPCAPRAPWALPQSQPHLQHAQEPGSPGPPSLCCRLDRLLTFCWT